MNKNVLVLSIIFACAIGFNVFMLTKERHKVNYSKWDQEDVIVEEPKKEEPKSEKVKEEHLIVAKTYTEALKIAKDNNKQILLFFTKDTCEFCQKTKKEVLLDPSVRNAMSKHIFCELNLDIEPGRDRRRAEPKDKEAYRIGKKYKVSKLPTFMIIDSNEEVMKRVSGYHDSESLIEWLN